MHASPFRIVTLTGRGGSDAGYADTTGPNGILEANGPEWMNAGGGTWRQSNMLSSGKVTGFSAGITMSATFQGLARV